MFLESNDGGDIFIINSIGNGKIHLKIGHCCVYEIDHIVPIEFLTSVLCNVVTEHGGVEGALRDLGGWDDDFMNELIGKIERMR